MIIFSNVFMKYTKEFYALYDVSFEAKKGDCIALLGPVDSGKTCILRILAGLEKPTKGEIYIKDIPLHKFNYKDDVSMGYIPYKANFFEKKTVYQNLKYVLKIRGISEAEQENLINKALIDYKIEKLKDEPIYKLSLYQKYLVSVARLSFRNLEIVLIDNIFEELSKEENDALIALFKKEYKQQNCIFIFATSSSDIAKSLGTKVIELENGSIKK